MEYSANINTGLFLFALLFNPSFKCSLNTVRQDLPQRCIHARIYHAHGTPCLFIQ